MKGVKIILKDDIEQNKLSKEIKKMTASQRRKAEKDFLKRNKDKPGLKIKYGSDGSITVSMDIEEAKKNNIDEKESNVTIRKMGKRKLSRC